MERDAGIILKFSFHDPAPPIDHTSHFNKKIIESFLKQVFDPVLLQIHFSKNQDSDTSFCTSTVSTFRKSITSCTETSFVFLKRFLP